MSITPFNVLPEEHQKQFRSAVKEWVYDYSNNEPKEIMAPMDKILAPWNEAKNQYLFKMFGNELMITKPICYKKAEKDIVSEIKDKIFNSNLEFVREIREKVIYAYDYRDPVWDIIDSRWHLDCLLDLYFLAKNAYLESDFSLPSPKGGKPIKVNTGCKLIRLLGKIAKEYDLKGFEEFRLIHSMILNDKEIKGDLVISIHPNDYATMSDNNYDWDSCMSWWNDGGYIQGTVEMMNSPMVVVAYIDNFNKPIQFGGGEWSNKKWRELFIVNENVISEICAYPYPNESITNIVLCELRELAVKNLGWNQFAHSHIVTYEATGNHSIYSDKFSFHFECGHMYNDFRYQHNMIVSNNIGNGNFDIYYSGKSECLWCGATYEGQARDENFEHEGTLIGVCCDSTWICPCCGERSTGERFHTEDGDVCEYCWENNVSECDECGDFFMADNVDTYYIGNEDEGWIDMGYSVNLCYNCRDNELNLMSNANAYPALHMVSGYQHRNYLDIRYLTEYGIDKFFKGEYTSDNIKEYVPFIQRYSMDKRFYG